MGKRIVWTEEQRRYAVAEYSSVRKSTRDLAGIFGVSFQSVAKMLRDGGVELSAGAHIRRKSMGVSRGKGLKRSPETCARMSAARKGHPGTTNGKRYTDLEKRNIADGLRAHYERQRAAGLLLSNEEKLARARCRSRFKRLIRRMSLNKANRKTRDLLGYDERQFRAHIEAQFMPAMSWQDRESFHVDHIVPVAWFLRRGITDPRIINALSNLQPLPPEVNMAKSDRVNTARYTAGLAA